MTMNLSGVPALLAAATSYTPSVPGLPRYRANGFARNREEARLWMSTIAEYARVGRGGVQGVKRRPDTAPNATVQEIERLVKAALDVLPLPRGVRKAELAEAISLLARAPKHLVAGALVDLVKTEAVFPPVATVLDRIEKMRDAADDDDLFDTLAGNWENAIVALDWNSPDDRALVESYGDYLPAAA